MKCPNCGTEVIDGASFCSECGASVPKIKRCISCEAELSLDTKFCPNCGTKQEVESGENSSFSGINMGDKNVIAGDVVSNVTNNTQIHHEEQITNNITNTTTNNTTIINQDDTKKAVVCECCGRNILVTESYKCNKCGKIICKDCFDIDAAVCYLCSPNQKVTKSNAEDVQEFINNIQEINQKIRTIDENYGSKYDTSSVVGFGKSLFKSFGNSFTHEEEIKKIYNQKEDIINNFTPSRTKRAFNDAILFMEQQRDTTHSTSISPISIANKNWSKIWSEKIISLINQANILFNDDNDFMTSLKKHAEYAELANSNIKTSLTEKMTTAMIGGIKNPVSTIKMGGFKFNKTAESKIEDIRPEDGRTCPSCGAVVSAGKLFCTKCGTKL